MSLRPDESLILSTALAVGGGPPGPAFCITQPNALPNLQAWFVADDIAQADATTVASWPAHLGISGGTPYTATAGAGNPIYRTNVLNGHAAVEAPNPTGLAATLKFSPDVNFPSSAFTDFMVYRSEPTGALANIIHGRQSGDPNISCVRMPDEGAPNVGAFIAYGGLVGGFISPNPFVVSGGPYHIGVARRFRPPLPPGKVDLEHDFFFDGADATNAAPLVNAGAYYGSGFFICKSDSFGTPGTQLVEWVLYTVALSDLDRKCVYNYLAQKYGFALLP